MLQQRHRFLPSRLIFVALLALVIALMGLFFDKTKTVAADPDPICNVMLVVDRSGSVGSAITTYRNQIKSLFGPGGINDNNISIGFWSFEWKEDTSGDYNSPRNTYVNSRGSLPENSPFSTALQSGEMADNNLWGPTSYQQGFGYKGSNQNDFNTRLASDASKADLVVFISDGLPNYPLLNGAINLDHAKAKAREAMSNLVNNNAQIKVVIGVYIKGQDPEGDRIVTYDGQRMYYGLANIKDVIEKNTNLNRSIRKKAISVEGFPSLAAGLQSTDSNGANITFECDPVPRSNMEPSVAASKPSISGDEENAFGYFVKNNDPGPLFSPKTDWSILRYVKAPNGTIIQPEQAIASGVDAQFKAASITQLTGSEYPTIESATRIVIDANWQKGTQICDVLEINVDKLTAPRRIRSSPPVCVTFAGFQPTFQVRGGDFYVGRHFATDETKKTNSFIDGRVAMTLGGQRFSSWAEYGVFATGDVKSFASGAAFSRTDAAAHPLTFANANNTYGKFISESLQPNLWTIPNVVATLLSGTYDDISLSASQLDLNGVSSNTSSKYVSDSTSLAINNSKTNKQLNEGARILINAPNTDVTIDSDIKLSNTYPNIDSLPQLIIVAKNIYIKPNVKEVNAWLIVQGTESDGGKINTCDFDTNASECETSPLRINGPIIARTLEAHRKYTRYDPSSPSQKLEPAEVFNLPATAYLYLLNKKTADNDKNPLFETSWSVELPPYF